MLGVEPLLAGVEAGDPGLEGGEVVLGPLGRAATRGLRGPRPAGRSPRRPRRPRDCSGVDLAGSRASPSRRSAAARSRPATRRSSSAAASSAPYAGRSPPRSSAARCVLDLGRDLATPGRGPARPRPRARSGSRPDGQGLRLGSRAALRTRSAASDAVPRSRSRRPDSANQVSWAPRQRGQVLAQRRLERAPRPRRAAAIAASTSSRRSTRTDSSASSCSSAVRAVTRSSASSRARASRTSAWTTAARRATSACRPSGLSWRRISLSRSLQPGEVAVGGVELAERLLLALAVLEDAGGLLDEAAPVLGGRVQDRVELALPDDHVHLAADAGVAEQLLDVEQPARRAVDGVLRAAVAEHGPADRDLGVLDRQRAVGVVDGQQHLGAAQRRAAGRCRRR